MKKIILFILSVLTLMTLLVGCSDSKDMKEEGIKVEINKAEVDINEGYGADMMSLDYASDDIIIFHGNIGLFVYDIKEDKMKNSIDLKNINCSSTQGDNVCVVNVSKDGEIVKLHPSASNDMYIYSVKESTLTKKEYEKFENEFTLVETPQDIKKLSYDYSYSAVKFKEGDMGILYSKDGTVGTLIYSRNDKEYNLFK